MHLLYDPQTWVSFLTLTVLEIVLGIDNIIFLAILVNRLPPAQRRSARILGLGFAMLTRIALLFFVVWLSTLQTTLFQAFGTDVSARDLVLFAGGAFLVVSSIMEIRDMWRGHVETRKPGLMNSLLMIIIQIGLIDIVFSLDTVFTAIGLAQHVEVMIAAIVVSVSIMMVVSGGVSAFIERYPTLKVLALAFLVMVGGALIAEALEREIPQGYLYFAMAFSAAVEFINIRLRRHIK